jgi:hypothetical protein
LLSENWTSAKRVTESGFIPCNLASTYMINDLVSYDSFAYETEWNFGLSTKLS